jgi:glutamyl-tRNA reductase
VREVTGVTLYDMDDLQRQVARNLSVREAERAGAARLVEDEAQRYEAWLASLEIVPTIAALRERGEAIVQQVIGENDGRWESLSEADRERVGILARAVVSRLLHEPTVRLKRVIEDDSGYAYLQALRELFGIDPQSPAEERPAPSAGVHSLADHRRRQRSG